MLSPSQFLVVGLLLALKHFVFDGPVQTAYQYLNKGKWGHPGGILHAVLHGSATLTAFLVIQSPLAGVLGLLDTAIHYGIDWAKVNLTAKYGWSYMMDRPPACEPDWKCGLVITSNWYFYALVADQALHFATYVFLIWLAMNF